MAGIEIEVIEGDALSTRADVLVLKYAQQFYGVDELVASRLVEHGLRLRQMEAAPDGHRLLETGGALAAERVLFTGVGHLYEFEYGEIREFARRSLAALAAELPGVRHVATTMHGVGFGLDEIEAFDAQIAGFMDAAQRGEQPEQLERISVVERDPRRAARLTAHLRERLPDGVIDGGRTAVLGAAAKGFQAAGHASADKPHIFVAMPFEPEMDDTYHYGIQGAVRAAGFLCERADLSAFVGDVMQFVKQRIRTSSLVIADLTESNPNVYLEVGYAWGCDVPTVLLVRDAEHLRFDVQGQRCLEYGSIRELEEKLAAELRQLNHQGAV